jgi:acylphosphatase
VQGVGFRVFVLHAARDLGLVGHVANRADGSVEVYAEGTPDALEQLLEELATGPPGSRVAGVESRFAEAERGVARFEIR